MLQSPKTSPEDRDTIEKIVRQLKIIIVDFPKTPPKDWHEIGNCVEQLKLIVIKFPNLPPHIRHDIGKLMEDSSIILEGVHDPKTPPKDRHTIEKTIGSVTGGLKMILDRETSMEDRKKIEKAVNQIADAVAAVIRGPKVEIPLWVINKIDQVRTYINRKAKSKCFEVEIVYAPGTWGNEPASRRKPLPKDDGGWATSAIEKDLSPPKEVGKVVLDWDYPTHHDLNDPSDAQKSVASGSKALVDYVNKKSAQCHDAKFILIGYSQGANVVTDALGGDTHNAYAGGQPKPTTAKKIDINSDRISVVLIGNPNRKANPEKMRVPDPYNEKTLDICIDGDLYCTPGSNPPPSGTATVVQHWGELYRNARMSDVGKCLRKEVVDGDECDHDELNKID